MYFSKSTQDHSIAGKQRRFCMCTIRAGVSVNGLVVSAHVQYFALYWDKLLILTYKYYNCQNKILPVRRAVKMSDDYYAYRNKHNGILQMVWAEAHLNSVDCARQISWQPTFIRLFMTDVLKASVQVVQFVSFSSIIIFGDKLLRVF